MRLMRLGVGCLLVVGLSSGSAGGNLVLNASFEESTRFDRFTDWQSRNVEQMGPFIDSFDGFQSVDLAQSQSGWMQQQLQTDPGELYRLEFYLSANIYAFRSLPRIARVLWAETVIGEFVWEELGTEDPSEARFERVVIDNLLAPTGATQLRFEDASATSGFGAVIDAVVVIPMSEVEVVPSPGTFAMGMVGLVGLMGRRLQDHARG
ncbi:hypothetical protein [Mucisphaera sp.]|uniref:hypothetical protein n=1 Tax=Mucisphaera sp. TaxID=2913024 RepID=UPI003D11F9EA